MSRFMTILFVILHIFVFAVVTMGVVRYHSIIRLLGPATMLVFMLGLSLCSIGFKKEYRHLHRGALSSLLFGLLFVIAYMLMCLLTGEDMKIYDFLFQLKK